METEKKFSAIEHSSAVEDILHRPPSWTTQYGTLAAVGSVFLLVLLAALIRYNDIVSGRVIVTTKNPIVKIEAKTDGEIIQVLVNNSAKVDSNQVLAILKTTALFKDVQLVKTMLKSLETKRIQTIDSLFAFYPKNLKLGELQEAYLSFYLQHQQLLLTDSLRPYQRFNQNVELQEKGQKKLLYTKSRQLSLISDKLKISKSNYDRSISLLSKGVVSQAEHEKILNEHLKMLEEYERLSANMLTDKIELSKLQNLLDESELNRIKSSTSYIAVYEQAFQSLKNVINNWEEKYVLRSPIKGVVSMHNVWEKYQNVKKNELVFSVVPIKIKSVIGIVSMPIARSGKVETGQQVIVKLSTYPSEQYGHLTGTVSSISSIPDQKELTYTVFIDIDSLTTSYGKEINLRQQMIGTAQIVTEKLSLLERLFYGFRKLFDLNPALEESSI